MAVSSIQSLRRREQPFAAIRVFVLGVRVVPIQIKVVVIAVGVIVLHRQAEPGIERFDRAADDPPSDLVP
jgi:hypothetical protein